MNFAEREKRDKQFIKRKLFFFFFLNKNMKFRARNTKKIGVKVDPGIFLIEINSLLKI